MNHPSILFICSQCQKHVPREKYCFACELCLICCWHGWKNRVDQGLEVFEGVEVVHHPCPACGWVYRAYEMCVSCGRCPVCCEGCALG
ncbi:MAG TPA: hypothetical protein PLF71_04125 [bacterium]|nr:hypothetical protein [bacterium]